MFDLRLENLLKHNPGYWATRALYQIEYAHELSRLAPKNEGLAPKNEGPAPKNEGLVNGKYDNLIENVIESLVTADAKYGTITQQAAQQAEALLQPLSVEAKRFTILCAAHAHIDMNWMWRWDETVSITLDTFRTMLDLMNEYPDFKFSQSQASVYQIVENYDSDMLQEIRKRVKEGRWEVTASTWVEADKNLPNGESHARHLLYTHQYLSHLLDLQSDQFLLDFEPDTFGHHANVPEILASGGVKYYYHCRGDNQALLYRWQAPSGRSILVYREPTWYLGYIEPNMALYAPSFCQQYGLTTMLKVYGVGDHGGGPTRRDLERIQDMNDWSVFPKIQFGTFKQFYTEVEKVATQLPVVTGELNFVFTGCYTSQSRIKQANRIAEASLNVSETFSAAASLSGLTYPAEKYAAAWRNTLFNQFHDIIPGSGVIDTREYARGLFQHTLALANSQKNRTFRALTQSAPSPATTDTSLSGTIAEGAGVGFGVEEFKLAQVSRGGGLQRLFHVFNPSPWSRQQVVELVAWDWDGDVKRIIIKDAADHSLRHQLLDHGWNDYWGHRYLRLLVELNVPACGYADIVLSEAPVLLDTKSFPLDPRTEQPIELNLENEHLRAVFDPQSCALVSFVDKATGTELVDRQRPALFRRILEDDRQGMTAWVVGRYMEVQELTKGTHILKRELNGVLRQSFTYEQSFSNSKMTVTVSLDAGSSHLDFSITCDWLEIGKAGAGVPQFNYLLPLAYPSCIYRYDIPFGSIERAGMALDVPANSWVQALPQGANQPSAQIITQGSYGFRGDENALALTLIRSSYDPDPYPELGVHKINFSVALAQPDATPKDLAVTAFDLTHPLDVVSGRATQPTQHSYFRLESDSPIISAIKACEDGASGELILRLYEINGQTAPASLHFDRPVASAWWVDVYEQPVHESGDIRVEGDRVTFTVQPYRLVALRARF
jgi:alpha-mannosidase